MEAFFPPEDPPPAWAVEYVGAGGLRPLEPAAAAAEGAVARPAYAREYAFAFAVLRALAEAGEASPRALRLTARCIALCPGHYSAWQCRRRVLRAMGAAQAEWAAELDLVDAAAARGAKNYQLWHHRRCALTELAALCEGAAEGAAVARLRLLAVELEATEATLEATDAKNYHAWAHRQWALAALGDVDAWRDELDFAARLIDEDVRNNSAWSHRALASRKAAGSADNAMLPASALAAEAAMVAEALRRAPRAEAAWSYLRGLYAPPRCGAAASALGDADCLARSLAEEALRADGANVHALELYCDCLEGAGEASAAAGGWEALARVDPLRARYYDYRKAQSQAFCS